MTKDPQDPRECDDCHEPAEARDMTYALAIDAHTLAIDFRARSCPRCARHRLDACPPTSTDRAATKAARALLNTRFGEPVRILWMQADEHRVGILCRRPTRSLSAQGRPRSPRRPAAQETAR